jgi:general secretion pathway protein C
VRDLTAKLALPASWLLVAAIAYSLATTVLYMVSPPVTAPSAANAATPAGTTRPAADINAILSRQMFGTAASGDAVVAIGDAPTVATQLPLELLGVFVADDPQQSAAIVAQRGRQGTLYAVGEEVPGSATLVEVQSDHVVLRRAGIREALYFPPPGAGLTARAAAVNAGLPPIEAEPSPDYDGTYEEAYDETMAAPPDEAPDASSAASPRELLESYRQRLDDDPDQTMAELGVAPVAAGAAEGYRVGDLAQSPYLSQTGLQPGDVILSVNGRPVGDLSQDRLELDNVLAEGSARLEVQRGSRRFFVTASLQ